MIFGFRLLGEAQLSLKSNAVNCHVRPLGELTTKNAKHFMMTKDIWDNVIGWLLISLVVLSLLLGLIIILWQTYNWLKTGLWIEMPVSKAFEYFGFDLIPIYHPKNWKGAAKIAKWFLAWPLCIGVPESTSILTAIIKVVLDIDTSNEEPPR